MKISVFGLGYVGTVSAACLAEQGHYVIGVEPNRDKTRMFLEGKLPISEPGLDALARFPVTHVARDAVLATDISLVCVGTPSLPNGALDTSHVEEVVKQIVDTRKIAGNAKDTFHVIVIRSTILPGTVFDKLKPLVNSRHFGLAVNPEFLREGSAVADFFDPPKTVVGVDEEEVAVALAPLYPEDTQWVPIRIAETVKYVDNVWHALKVSFANEIGAFCRDDGTDPHEVMKVFCSDTKLNISTAYLRPGFAFGGSCLPKDVRALTYQARSRGIETPLLDSILISNKTTIGRGIQKILNTGAKKIAFLGFTFKPGTDDLRESPWIPVIKHLARNWNINLSIYDKHVSLSKIFGANKDYLEKQMPYIGEILCETPVEAMSGAELVVVTAPEYAALVPPGQRSLMLS